MKKAVALFCTAVFVLTCGTGCGKKNNNKQDETATDTPSFTDRETTSGTENTTTMATHAPIQPYPDSQSTRPDSYGSISAFTWNALDRNQILYADDDCTSDLSIPATCTSIAERAFANNTVMETVTFHNPETALADGVFENCAALRTVSLPEKLETIPDALFQDCVRLSIMEIPESVREIGESAFYGCTSLLNLNMREGLKVIGDTAFYGCSSLVNVYIPEGVTEIGDYAFGNCANLGNIYIPETVTQCGLYPISGAVGSDNPIQVSVKAGSWMDRNFEMCLGETSCVKICY